MAQTKNKKNSADFSEIGVTGLSEFSGQIRDDFLRELQGKEAYKRYDEMRRNSPIIGALLLAFEQSIRGVSWEFASDAGANDPRIEFLTIAKDGMSHSWNDHITEVLTMLPFGFSLFELCYRRNEAGQIVWRKLAIRGQDTIYRWTFDETGGLSGIEQQALPTYMVVPIPIEKLLLYRTRVERNNPEGRSILRTAWIPYYFVKHIQQIEAIGIERDLAGLPWIKLPPGVDDSDSDNSDFGKARKLVRNVRNDEQAGIVTPAGWEFTLVSTGGSRQFDTDKIVRRYQTDMLKSALAQFLALGQDGVGSLALSKDQTDFFTMSVNAVADVISETFTKYAIPRLLAMNGFDTEGIRLEHTPAGDVDTAAIADLLQKVGNYITWTGEDELWLRQTVGMPETNIKTIEAGRAEIAAQKQAALDAFRQKQDATDQTKDDTPSQDSTQMSVDYYAADPPDDAKRRKREREFEKAMSDYLEASRKRILKAAKEMRKNA